MSKHTPGPWAIEPHWMHVIPADHLGRPFGGSIHDEDDKLHYFQTIAAVSSDRHERGDAMANARLIAAAPDLLAACHKAIRMCAEGDDPRGTIKALEFAIARAEGRPQ